MTDLNTIFSWFETGDFPTQQQFQATFSSFFHKNEPIPYSSVAGLDAKFNLMLPASQFAAHLSDENAHYTYLAKKDASNIDENVWKLKLGIENIATVDPNGNVYTKTQIDEFVHILENTDTDINAAIDYIENLLNSNDLNLDELQEIVNYIKQNRADIDALQAIQIGVTTEDKVKLNGDYFGETYENQEELNRKLESFVNLVNPQEWSMEKTITGSTIFPHPFATDKLIIQVRDSVTGKRVECEDFATSTNIQINFLTDVANPMYVLIYKIA